MLVHQEIMLAPDLTIAENMFLGREVWRGLTFDDREMNRRALEAMRVFGVDAPVTVPVERLSIAQRQLAQIARALAVAASDRHFRRADRVADAGRDDRAAAADPRAQGEGRRGALHFASARRGQSDRRRRDRAARRQAGRDAAGRASSSRSTWRA